MRYNILTKSACCALSFTSKANQLIYLRFQTEGNAFVKQKFINDNEQASITLNFESDDPDNIITYSYISQHLGKT